MDGESFWGHGREQAEFWRLVEELVPERGQAATVQGELVRAILRLTGEYRRNGNINWGSGYLMLADYLDEHLHDARSFDPAALRRIDDDIDAIRACGLGDLEIPFDDDFGSPFDRITEHVVRWVRAHPAPIPHRINRRLDL